MSKVLNGDSPKSNINRISRTKCSENFTIIQNAILEDRRLGAVALAIVVYILHRPPDWRVCYEEVMARLHIGRKAFRRGWNELIATGYVRTRQGHREDGRIGEFEIYVSDQGSAPLYPLVQSGKTVSGERLGGNERLLSTDTVSTDRQRTDLESAVVQFPGTGIKTTDQSQLHRESESGHAAESTGPSVNGHSADPPDTGPKIEAGAAWPSPDDVEELRRIYKHIPNLEAVLDSGIPWAREQARKNGGDWRQVLRFKLTKDDRAAALEREQVAERAAKRDRESRRGEDWGELAVAGVNQR